MLHFLSSLFSSTAQPAGGPDPALIEAATERAIEGTDPRLRALRHYRKRLREPVTQAVRHITELVDSLPEPVEISRRNFSTDPRLRAFFVSPDHLQEVLGGIRSITGYLQGHPGPRPDTIFGLLSMEWKQRTTLGIEQQGELTRRDVPQVAVRFFNHRFAGPSGSRDETRRELGKRAFDYLVKMALEGMLAVRSKRRELQREQQLLARKLGAMQAGDWGLETLLSQTEPVPADLESLEAQIDAVETELLELGADTESLEHSLDQLAGVLEAAEQQLSRRRLSLRLNHMGIRVEETSGQPSNLLELTELFSSSGEQRIILPGCFPRNELPERPDFFQQARRYLE